MKQIINWRLGTTFDIESDSLLDEATIFHVLSFHMSDGKSGSIEGDNHGRFKAFLNYHIENKIPLVAHNGILFDVALCEKLLDVDLSELMVIDTLALSWYLNTTRKMHGLDSFLEDYGIKKPKIDNWEDLTYEEYKHRCEEDVKINVALWQDMMRRLTEIYTMVKKCIDGGQVGSKRMSPEEVTYLDQYKDCSTVDEYVERLLTFLMFKMDCARLQEKTRWRADYQYLLETEEELDERLLEAKVALEAIMPPVAKYGFRKKPEEPLKKDGTPKQTTLRWNTALGNIGKLDQYGNEMTKLIEGLDDQVKVINKYEQPNINSSTQLKKLFDSYGWEPETFKYVKDEAAMEAWVKGGFKKSEKPVPRKIPQISKDGEKGKELCPSIVRLAKQVPEILKYDKYTMVKHRSDTNKGFLRDLSEDGYLKARMGGFTNTLRIKHREIVNLVGVDKPYGENIRGALTCNDDEILLGSDLSSLEDRVKHHFMLPHDPEYVATMMADDYDPHILTAHSAGMITDLELKGFKEGTLSGAIKDEVGKARKGGKCTNYASVYGGSPDAISRSAGIDVSLAKQLHEGYWKLNWSVKAIADEQCVFEDSRKQKWLINPINGLAYSLRTEKDRFSTLCQGTGSYFFDMWVDNVLERFKKDYGFKTLTGSFHDEIILCFQELTCKREDVGKLVFDSIQKVNVDFLLRRDLGCDVQFDKRYSGIH